MKFWGRVARNTLITFLFLVFLLPSDSWPNSHPDETIPFRLGGLRIGETLNHFRERFPGAACGTVNRFPINRHTLDDPDGSDDLTCCVDDPNLIAKFSELKVLTVEGQCPVLLSFWKQRLASLGFTVEASSVEKLLTSFEKTYGPPSQTMHGRDSLLFDHLHTKDWQDAPLSLASWWFGDARLQLSIAILNSANGYAQERRLVQVDMWIGIDPRYFRW